MLNRQTLSQSRNRYEFGGSIKWNITRYEYPRTYAFKEQTLGAQCLRIQRCRNLYPMGRMKTTAISATNFMAMFLVSYNHRSIISVSATAG